jgi:VacB/RNase II family 3'-5' exoribonuclease
MFSNDQLSQLTQLKQDIRSSKDMAQGTVRATSGRFGFVTLDDGREAFLNPEQMERVFPGDRVEIEVTTTEKEKFEAKLEKLISSEITFLSGRYRIRGKGHFIATDDVHFSRWIFIPPKNRAKCQEGHYATAKIIRHPFKDGRAQAAITSNIGDAHTPHIERLYTLGKYQLSEYFTKNVLESAQTLCENSVDQTAHNGTEQQDLRHIPFITIDSASTRDMDDALAIEANDNGWTLSVAIAAPSADIKANSPLDKAAQQRGQTTYFADRPLTMLPEQLSLERYSLQCQQDRSSLVLQCHIDTNGHVSAFTFIPALIQSHAKLSYAQVAAELEGRDFHTPASLSDITPFKEQLALLHTCSKALHAYRKEHYIIINNHNDVALYLNDKGKLDRIEKIERNCAHSIVEEAMLLTNRYAGQFLAEHKAGLFVTHKGYRNERRQDIESLLTEKMDVTIDNTDQLASYIQTIKTLQNNAAFTPLLSIQQRFLEPSQLTTDSNPHFGLGFEQYATITSPIRRYQDLYNQRAILDILAGNKVNSLKEDALTTLKENIQHSRSAAQFMERWLISDFMQDKIGQTFSGTISLLTNQGVGVRLDDTAIEGFIPAIRPNKKAKEEKEKKGDKISFNNQRMELTWNEQNIALDQPVTVTLAKIDHEKKKLEFTFNEAPSVANEPSSAAQ